MAIAGVLLDLGVSAHHKGLTLIPQSRCVARRGTGPLLCSFSLTKQQGPVHSAPNKNEKRRMPIDDPAPLPKQSKRGGVSHNHTEMLLRRLLHSLYFFLPLAALAAPGDLLWSDEFEVAGRPDSRYWNFDVGGGGWGNWEFQDYLEENAVVDPDGTLKITARRTSDTTFTSARLKTADKLFVQYGTIEARINFPDVRKGLWAAFWTIGQSFPAVLWPACGVRTENAHRALLDCSNVARVLLCRTSKLKADKVIGPFSHSILVFCFCLFYQELDIMEIGGAFAYQAGVPNRRVLSAVHMERGGQQASTIDWGEAPNDLNGTFHTYRMEWTPDSVLVMVDDIQTLYVPNINMDTCIECEELHQPHAIVLNLAVGGGFTHIPGDPNDNRRITATFPATMAVDYVRIYDNGFTTLSGSAVEGGPVPAATAPPIPAPVATAAPIPTPVTATPITAAPVITPTTLAPVDPPTQAPTMMPTVRPITGAPATAAPKMVDAVTLSPTTRETTITAPTTTSANTTVAPSTQPSVVPSLRPTVLPTAASSNSTTDAPVTTTNATTTDSPQQQQQPSSSPSLEPTGATLENDESSPSTTSGFTRRGRGWTMALNVITVAFVVIVGSCS